MNAINIDIDPTIFHLGGLALRWYGLTFVGGVALALLLIMREAGRRGLDTSKVSHVALWAVAGGVAGARLFHVADNFSYYLSNPYQILMVNQGGLAIWGGLVTGGLMAVWAAHRVGIPALMLADATAIGAIPGQIVGRVGCLINGDAYGGPTNLPWGVVYTNPAAFVPDAFKGIATHPYPVYEILWNLAVLGLLLVLRRQRLPAGSLFLTYVAGYALGRFTLTFVRQEAVILWGLQQAQVVALAALVLAAMGAVYLVAIKPSTRSEKWIDTGIRAGMARKFKALGSPNSVRDHR